MTQRANLVRRLAAGSAILAVVVAGQAAAAETLADAIALAYSSNPTLQGARATLRSLDENLVQARAGYGPQVSVTGSINSVETWSLLSSTPPTTTNGSQATLSLQQPLYTGGRVDSRVRTATGQILAGQQQLRSQEANILIGVVTAYADVLRDQRAVVIRQQSLETFRAFVEEITARQKAGQVTLTDVALAQAQYESERSLVSSAAAQLQASRASYAALVGQNPGDLAPLPPLPGLPATLEEALASADQDSPSILQAMGTEQAARGRVAQARAEYLPQVSLRGDLSYSSSGLTGLSGLTERETGTATLSFTQPIFQAGQRSSQVRQAQAASDGARTDVEAARRASTQNVLNAWNGVVTQQRNLLSAQAAYEAAARTFEGMQIEYRNELRSTYEVLNAEERLRDSEIAQIVAEHDGYVAQARLLAFIGRLDGPDLIDGLATYDAKANLRRVENDGGVPTDIIADLLDKANLGAGEVKPIDGPPPASLPAKIKPAAVTPRPDSPIATASPPTPQTPTKPQTAQELGLRLQIPELDPPDPAN